MDTILEAAIQRCKDAGYHVVDKDRILRIAAQAFINMEHWEYMVTGVQEVLMKQTKFAMAKALADKLLEKLPTDFEPQSIEGGLQIRVALDVILPTPCPSIS